MQRVIVTVKREGEARLRDLEVPTDVEAERLTEMIARALHWEQDAAGQPLRYEVEAHPLGRILQANESLASAGVWDGSWLVFRLPGDSVADGRPSRIEPPSSEVVRRWHPLGINVPPPSGSAPPTGEASPSSGYVWRRVDE